MLYGEVECVDEYVDKAIFLYNSCQHQNSSRATKVPINLNQLCEPNEKSESAKKEEKWKVEKNRQNWFKAS